MMQNDDGGPAYDAMGLANTQRFATLFDGITRHSRRGVVQASRGEVASQQAVRGGDGASHRARGSARWPGGASLGS